MASLAVRPSTVSFVETLLHGTQGDLLLEDLTVAPQSALAGVKLADLLHRCPGILVQAVQRGGEMLAPPAVDLVLQPGDVLAIVGSEAQLRALEEAGQAPASLVTR
jgi:voltage-gated potassium channel